MMRAIRVSAFGGPEVLKIAEVPIPSAASGQVIVKVAFAGVNPVETYIRSGQYARLPSLPFTPGKDFAGTVHQAPEGSQWTKGERVFGQCESGSYAEFASVAEESLWALPAAASLEQGACLGVPYFTAHRALFLKANARPGETVLVHGASGGVGTAAVQVAKAAGLTVLGTAGTQEGLDLVRAQGADHVFNHRQEGYLDEILSATSSRGGVDVVVEMLSNVNLNHDLGLLRPGGRVAIVGARGSVEVDPRRTMMKETAILGVGLFAATPAEMGSAGEWLTTALAAGTLRPVVGKAYGLADAARAHQDIVHPPNGASGNLVIDLLQ